MSWLLALLLASAIIIAIRTDGGGDRDPTYGEWVMGKGMWRECWDRRTNAAEHPEKEE